MTPISQPRRVCRSVDSDDVFGIFAANGLTKLAWGAAAAVLLVLALLPRVGARKHDPDADQDQPRHETLDVERPIRTVKREPDRIRPDRGSRATTDQSEAGDRVVAPASGRTPASRDSLAVSAMTTLSREMQSKAATPGVPLDTTTQDPVNPKESE